MQYYTLVASLAGTPTATPTLREEILGELSSRDRRVAELLLALEKLAPLSHEDIEALYQICELSSSNFLREWARFDYDLRSQIAARTLPLLEKSNIIEKERELDSLRWSKADELSEFDTFGLPTVLAYLIKLGIVSRWAALDPETGRQMYDKLVNSLHNDER